MSEEDCKEPEGFCTYLSIASRFHLSYHAAYAFSVQLHAFSLAGDRIGLFVLESPGKVETILKSLYTDKFSMDNSNLK